MPANITLSGFKEFEQVCATLPTQLLEEFDAEAEDATREWASLAKNDAPVDQGFLRGQITNHKIKDGHWETVSPVDYSAFIEWGTKTKVRVPAELQSYAEQFKGGTGQTGAKKMIYAWMNRVGIDKQFQWIVFISIITKGINPHPYFFIQSPIIEEQFISACRNILKTEH